MTDPLDRLSALRSGTVPPLPGAAAARARGRQRTRRTRGALAGAAAVLAVVSVSAVSALAGGTSPAPAPPVASSAPTAETPLQAALLDADDVDAELVGTWRVRQTEDLPFLLELPTCSDSLPAQGEVADRFFDGPDGAPLGTRIELLPDEGAAQGRYAQVTGGIGACVDQVPGYRQVEQTGPAESLRGELVEPEGARPFVLSRVGRAVVLLLGGPQIPAGLVDAADAEVRAAFPATPDPVQTAPPSVTASPRPAPVVSSLPPLVLADGQSASFRSPTGNIHCGISLTQVSCDLSEFTYEPPPRPADCDLDWGGMLVLDAEGARFLCYSDTNLDERALVLEYGSTIQNDRWTCTSRETGMTCTEFGDGSGFTLSRSRYQLS